MLHVDEDLVVVDKPSGMLSQAAPRRDPRDALPAVVAGWLKSKGERGELHAVHRLDEETSGPVVLARSTRVRGALVALFERREVERVYHALVTGTPHPASGTFTDRVSVGSGQLTRVVRIGGVRAVTQFATLARREGYAVVACRLETGRRNQIRAQFAHRGWPLVGDRKYGYRQRGAARARRAMLHASALAFVHPGTAHELRVVAAFPADFRELLGDELAGTLSLEI